VNLYQSASCLYGQIRGFDRWRIRRAVERNASRPHAELAEEAAFLFDRRVRESVRRFPSYAAKVRSHRGELPGEGCRIRPEDLPVWTREDQRALFEAQSAPPMPGSFVHSTGGSTGVPLRFHVTRASFEWRTAVSDRGYSWAGAEEGRRSYYVWGTPIRPPRRTTRWKQQIHHALQRRTYFDSFRFGDVEKEACCRAISSLRPRVIVGYAGNLIELAWFVKSHPDLWTWRPEALVTAAEGLAPGRRELLEAYLGGKVFMSYGSREFMLIGMECAAHSGYHIASDNLCVEVVDAAGRPVAPGETGRILVTDLHNDANPFVRYEIGDLGTIREPGRRCPCGLPFPLLAKVEGRLQEVIVTASGERLTALFIPHLMKEFAWVQGYQLVQERPGEVMVNLVSRAELSEVRTAPVAKALRAKMGAGAVVSFSRVEALRRNASGKTPIVLAGSAGKAFFWDSCPQP
jgi:phenylacetate-CoA ligase